MEHDTSWRLRHFATDDGGGVRARFSAQSRVGSSTWHKMNAAISETNKILAKVKWKYKMRKTGYGCWCCCCSVYITSSRTSHNISHWITSSTLFISWAAGGSSSRHIKHGHNERIIFTLKRVTSSYYSSCFPTIWLSLSLSGSGVCMHRKFDLFQGLSEVPLGRQFWHRTCVCASVHAKVSLYFLFSFLLQTETHHATHIRPCRDCWDQSHRHTEWIHAVCEHTKLANVVSFRQSPV